MAEGHTTADAAACSTEFFSAHVESLREALCAVDVGDKEARVEVEIEASKVHWSELTIACVSAEEVGAVELTSTSTSERVGTSEVERVREWNETVAKDNVEVFWSLRARYPSGFFFDENDVGCDHVQRYPQELPDGNDELIFRQLKLSSEKPFAEGAQAQLFHAYVVKPSGERIEEAVMKVFKEGTSLRGLQRLLPPSMLDDKYTQKEGSVYIEGCNVIVGATLLKVDGRFAFLMLRAWGDLRKLIDTRMLRNNKQGAPFPNEITAWCMGFIALGMQSLHARGIVHRDLKAANVLVMNYVIGSEWADVDPFLLREDKFACLVADYECSIGVVGTGFWRAPEILLALKNRNVHEHPEIASKQMCIALG